LAHVRNRVREYRTYHALTQESLANYIGVRRETILHIEYQRYAPSLPLAFKIARAFDADLEDVFLWEEETE